MNKCGFSNCTMCGECMSENNDDVIDYEPTINELTNAEYEYFAQCNYDATHKEL